MLLKLSRYTYLDSFHFFRNYILDETMDKHGDFLKMYKREKRESILNNKFIKNLKYKVDIYGKMRFIIKTTDMLYKSV
jgi:hypothetical protein